MSAFCTFALNNRETSELSCAGFGSVEAYSGQKQGRDNPNAVDKPLIGPLPPGTYYLVDRQSGGRLGWFWDWIAASTTSTDHRTWFMLWNAHGGDVTMIHGIQRGAFRLHPEGNMRLSEGCITVKNPAEFERLQRYIRGFGAHMSVPGSNLKAYGRVEVR
ncbi:DUF2778 domain-containing protein [bacterium M00.F.Ca.ET.228.01.1.1]|uniref:DUF2778 domain-containing protein n=1 Tax=Paraburkholderia phenoliruptrix TaxID=252970 RepID=UPI0010932503|nr:DUF2778 domain-containing protein [Paraburkholderia phenoliruptrix]TGP47884.1 DUF2778 domain-containing protein [bacterium M00.F.Ca.ET.228.01.1.1]TGS05677.1 DUF2778 domain-containing protein [bacterium M00.F.Ca.ET.191.01.1.1]TGU10613.1 DUF2778 domain-containing protein [bacterium M00.F.Ca.ET.155.01.1.1]MBW0445311.1 DUF2778 domain-containing protein [Paraburkholderia phenoliruptrix]MBW9096076.1 DUF2778 domain-containing protein [Paraburkholderia phenoliruptrix]